VAERFAAPAVQKSLEVDLTLIATYDRLLTDLELDLVQTAKAHEAQTFVSSGRLVKGAKESAGKRYGTSGTKIGNAYLTWAFSEAAVLFLRNNPTGQKSLARLERQPGKGKA
jgi:hypothetical protein